MADHFEKAKDDILLRTEGNGGPSNRDMLKAMGALAQDMDEAIDALDKRQKTRHDESVAAMKEHICYADVRDERLEALETWRHESSEKCVERMTAIAKEVAATVAAEVHAPVHEMHMAREHNGGDQGEQEGMFPTGDKRTLMEIIFGWSILKWAVAGACMAGIVFGISYWGSSCAAERVENNALETQEIHYASPSP